MSKEINFESVNGKKNIIELQELPFSANCSSKLVTSRDLYSMIRMIMEPITNDFIGSKIDITGPNLSIVLGFSDNGSVDNKFKFLTSNYAEQDEQSLNRRELFMRAVEQPGKTSSTNTLTKNAKTFFKHLIPRQVNGINVITRKSTGINKWENHINWNMVCREKIENSYNRNRIYMSVLVNPIELIRLMFGERDEENHFTYEINAIRPLSFVPSGSDNTEFLFNISRISDEEMRAIANQCQMIPSSDNCGFRMQ